MQKECHTPEPPSPSRETEGVLVDETLRAVAGGAEDGLRDGGSSVLGVLLGEGALIGGGAPAASLVPIPLVSFDDIGGTFRREVEGQ